MSVSRQEAKALITRARKVNPKAYMDLKEVYATTDMPYDEFIRHVRLIAEGKG